MNNLVQYIKNSYEELRFRVTWLEWKELQSSTTTVIIGVVILALVLGLVDFVISQGVSGIFKYLN